MATQSQLETYKIINEGKLLSGRRLQVYFILLHFGPCTGAEVSEVLRRRTGCTMYSENARNRLGELVRMGSVIESGKKLDPATGKENTIYCLTDKLPKKLPKKITAKKQLEECKRILGLIDNAVEHYHRVNHGAHGAHIFLTSETQEAIKEALK